MKALMKKLVRDERGVSALEYAILAAVIVVGVAAAVTTFGDSLGEAFGSLTDKVTNTINPSNEES